MNFVKQPLLGLVCALAVSCTATKRTAENIAPKAMITASSEYSEDYQARFVADGQVPSALGNADEGKAWCVNGATHRDGAELALEWRETVKVAEIVCYGRTAWFFNECWKGYEIYLDDGAKPWMTGQLKQGHGAQRITLKSTATVKRLRVRFTSSYGGHNPGMSELQVYSVSPPDALIGEFSSAPGAEDAENASGT